MFDINQDENKYEIRRWINKIDEVAVAYEAKWGVTFLQQVAPQELRDKWDRHIEKQNAAMLGSDPVLMRQLAEGTMRAWKALEDSAVSLGHKPKDAEYWEVRHNDYVFRICKNDTAAAAASGKGVLVYTLTEVANVLASRQLCEVLEVKKAIQGAKVVGIKPAPVDFKDGDPIPF